MTAFEDAKQVAVLGSGTMGQGIAQTCADHGFLVNLHDVDDATAKKGHAKISAQLEKRVEKGKISHAERLATLEVITPMSDLALAVKDADIIIEAIPERIDWKLDLFRQLDALAPKEALLATNTSSLSVTEIAGVTSNPGRVVGLHFFNPVPVMELLEIVRGMRTDDETIEHARALAKRLEKRSILVKDVPGFATSRLGVAIGAEAIRMLESGVASAEDIDTAMELGYRHPMGPLRLTDLVGLDVRLSILEHLHREVGEQFRPPTLLRQMVRAGKLGRKTGEGFYKY